MAGSNDVEIRVRVADRTGPGLASARHNVDALGGAIGALAKGGLAIPALLGVAGAAAQVAGAALIIPGALGAVVAISKTVEIGMTGVSDALSLAAEGGDKYREALAKLAPEAQEFVKTTAGLSDEWEELTRSVQGELFDGLAEQVQGLADTYIPDLIDGLSSSAAAMNDMANYAAEALMDPGVVKAVNVVLENTAGLLFGARTALGDFIAGFIELAAIGSEYLPGIGVWLSDIAAQFRSWVETNPDGIREFIDAALQGLADLWAIGENVVGIIAAIAGGLASGGEGGQTFLEAIRGLTESILAFVESEGVQGMLGFLGFVVQKMIEFAPVTLGVIGVILLLQGAIAVANFGLAAYNAIMILVRGATLAWAGVQWLLNSALLANPIGLVIIAVGALVAAFIWAWNNIDGFRNFWIGVWDAIVGAFNWAKDGIAAGWDWLVSKVTGAADWISQKLSGMWGGIQAGAKVAINGAIWALNGLIIGVNAVIRGLNMVNPFGQIGYVGHIGYLAKGGNASGLNIVGENGPELVDLPTGSRVRTAGDTQRELGQAGGGGGGPTVIEMHISGNTDSAMATAIMKLQRTGQLQLRVAR
jgi:hypothetical protein